MWVGLLNQREDDLQGDCKCDESKDAHHMSANSDSFRSLLLASLSAKLSSIGRMVRQKTFHVVEDAYHDFGPESLCFDGLVSPVKTDNSFEIKPKFH